MMRANSLFCLPRVHLATDLGKITLELDVLSAPVTASSFLKFVAAGGYDGGSFVQSARADNDRNPQISIIQASGRADRVGMAQSVALETTASTGLRHCDGAISLGRLAPDSGSAAVFFICVGDQPALDFDGARNPDELGYAAFGRVIDGMMNVRRINRLPTKVNPTRPELGSQWLVRPVQIIRADVDRLAFT